MRVRVTNQHPPGTIVTPTAYDNQIGRKLPLKGPGGVDWGLATVISAEVYRETVDLILEVDDELLGEILAVDPAESSMTVVDIDGTTK